MTENRLLRRLGSLILYYAVFEWLFDFEQTRMAGSRRSPRSPLRRKDLSANRRRSRWAEWRSGCPSGSDTPDHSRRIRLWEHRGSGRPSPSEPERGAGQGAAASRPPTSLRRRRAKCPRTRSRIEARDNSAGHTVKISFLHGVLHFH